MFKSDIEGSQNQYRDSNKIFRLNGNHKDASFCAPSIKFDRYESASGAKLAVVYLPKVSSNSTVRIIESRIRDIKFSSAKEIQSYLLDSLNTLSDVFPLVRKTKNIEMARRALLKGGVLILVDGSKYALVAPRSLGQLLLKIPAYLDCICPIISRALNYIALLTSLFLSSLYIAAFSMPLHWMSFETGQYILNLRSTVIYPAVIEVLILESIAELIREALCMSPPKYGLASITFSACAIGRMLMGWSIFSPILVMIVSTSFLLSFLIPDYLTIHSLRVLKLLMVIATGIFGIYGFAFFVALIIMNIIILNRSGIPYSPFGWYELIHAFLWGARAKAKCK